LLGLEDSSRYWSVWMTLDHLRIVHGAIVRIMNELAKGVVPPGRVSTAAVKPNPNVSKEVVAAYQQSCVDLCDTATMLPELHTKVRCAHPWFGPLDAFGWLALAAMHLTIHRKQIQEILSRQGATRRN